MDVKSRARVWKPIVCTFGISVLVTGTARDRLGGEPAKDGLADVVGRSFQGRQRFVVILSDGERGRTYADKNCVGCYDGHVSDGRGGCDTVTGDGSLVQRM